MNEVSARTEASTSYAAARVPAQHARALEAWESALGPANVLTDRSDLRREEANVSGLSRSVRAVLRPGSTAEVQAIVLAARRFRVPLYPFSTGKNWGLGSRLPVEGGAVLVDLGRMKAIRELDGQALFATVEPGVTQGQLYAEIARASLPVRMNVTGSSAATSLIGNAVERGIGYLGLRADETSNLEVVLGTGEILRTGFGGSHHSRLAPLYRHGIGPSLDGLFFQSNFGIVTAATFALKPEPEAHLGAVVSIGSESDLPALIDALGRASRAGCFDDVVHIGDRARTETTMAPLVARALATSEGLDPASAEIEAMRILAAQGFSAWSGLVGISGSKTRVADSLRRLSAEVSPFARVRVLTDRRLAWARRVLGWLSVFSAARRASALLEAVTPLYGLTRGIPTDAAVASVGFAAGDRTGRDPDESDAGMIYCLPLMPLSGAEAAGALRAIRAIGAEHEVATSITFNVLDARVLEAVVSIAFRRSDAAAAARARRCNDKMRRFFIELGLSPYRVDVDAMGDIVDPESVFWQTALALKETLDPEGIIARGRYNLA